MQFFEDVFPIGLSGEVSREQLGQREPEEFDLTILPHSGVKVSPVSLKEVCQKSSRDEVTDDLAAILNDRAMFLE